MNDTIETPLDQVAALLARYSNPRGSAAHYLCDRHDPVAIAYTLVAPDLSAVDLSYGALRSDPKGLQRRCSRSGCDPAIALRL
jgi:acetyl-CoA synthetase